MILIEDANNEKYHINPKQVIYVKEREHMGRMGEALVTNNEQGAKAIIASIKSKKVLN